MLPEVPERLDLVRAVAARHDLRRHRLVVRERRMRLEPGFQGRAQSSANRGGSDSGVSVCSSLVSCRRRGPSSMPFPQAGVTRYRNEHPAGGQERRGMRAKQERFVVEYLKDLNATKAAIRAGYHSKMAAKLVARSSITAAIAAQRGAPGGRGIERPGGRSSTKCSVRHPIWPNLRTWARYRTWLLLRAATDLSSLPASNFRSRP
jgi:hypothetical protein